MSRYFAAGWSAQGTRTKTAFKRGVATERKRHGHIMNTKLTTVVDLTSGGSGTINDVFDLHNPAVSVDGAGNAYTDWSSFSTLYDQYRVRAIKMKFYPSAPADVSSSTTYNPLFLVYDKDSSTAIATNALAAIQSGSVAKNLCKPWSYYRKLRKIGPKDQDMPGGWVDCANPHSQGAIKSYGDSLNNSKQYGTLVISMYVQFKNRI